MAENLLSRPLMNKQEITDFLQSDIEPLINLHNNSYITRMIEKLSAMRHKSLTLERQAYSYFQVNSIEELQIKLNKINDSGLLFLSNKALSRMPVIRQTKDNTISRDAVIESINDAFRKYLRSKEGVVELDSYIASLTEAELQKLYNEMAQKQGKSKRYKGFILKDAKNPSKIIYKMSGAIKRSLAKEYGIVVKNNFGEDYFEIIFDTDSEAVFATLKAYPYFALTEEQQEIMLKDKDVWNKFKLVIKSTVNDIEIKNTIEDVMNRMTVEAFVSTGGSYQDIIGILGELQGLVILQHLTGQQSEFLGHVKDTNGKKIGIDLALAEIGFQVKNYSMIETKTGDNVINLGKDYTVKGFLDVVDRSLEFPDSKEALSLFYAISAYHVAKTGEMKELRSTLTTIEKDRLPRLYSGAVADLLPLKELNLEDGRTMQNVFYLIGGTKIFPVSAILSRFIDFLRQIEVKDKVLTVRTIYEGTTINELKRGKEFPGYKNILDNIKLHYNIGMGINSTIQQALSFKD